MSKGLAERPGEADQKRLLKDCLLADPAVKSCPRWACEVLLQHCQRQLESSQPSRYARRGSDSHEIKTYDDLLDCFRELRADDAADRVTVTQKLQDMFPKASSGEIGRALGLCFRLAFFVDVRCDDKGRTLLTSLKSFGIPWALEVPLRQVLGGAFPRSRYKLTSDESRLHPQFTAAFMVRVCSLKIDWTDNLADHLYLDRQNNTLLVFPLKACLAAILSNTDWKARKLARSARGQGMSLSLPRTVLHETIMSLNLLFPHWDHASNALLELHKQNFHRHEPYDGPRTLNLMEFDHWRDRLLELKDVVFTSPPASIRQLFMDRRNPQQFWTFWIAIIILFLTVVSTVASVYQAAKS
jgi:hypothetical protein